MIERGIIVNNAIDKIHARTDIALSHMLRACGGV